MKPFYPHQPLAVWTLHPRILWRYLATTGTKPYGPITAKTAAAFSLILKYFRCVNTGAAGNSSVEPQANKQAP